MLSSFMASVVTPSANAADILGDQVQETTQVEYGTGWYLRGHVAVTAHENLFSKETSTPIAGTTDQLVKEQETSNVFSAGIGMGYRFSRNFRADIELASLGMSKQTETSPLLVLRAPCLNGSRLTPLGGIIPNVPITNCIEDSESSYDLQNVMANIYYDFDNKFLGFRPFIGMGAGLVRTTYTSIVGSVTCQAAEEERCGPTDGGTASFGGRYQQQGERNNGTAYHLAGSVSLGGSYRIAENLFLDTSYTYLKTLNSPIWGGPYGLADAEVPTNFHQVKFGLRLEIW
ncbi:MAG: outer membrane beta-barrel protein [Rhizobiaceae bacterium]